jgi:hypothetical protein
MVRPMRRAFPFLVGLAALAACDQAGSTLVPSIDDGLPSTCSPLRVPGACDMPWPNAIYTKPDATTVTGLRVALDPTTLPSVSTTGEMLDVTRWNMADGFSPAGPAITYFAETIDPASLVPETNIGASLQPGAATAIVDMTTDELVAHFSGVDANVVKDGDRQALLITPAQRLLPNRRYAVAVTNTVRTTDGGLPTPPPLFEAIAAGTPPSDALSQAEAARMPDILAALDAAGVPRATVLVAWDFVTGSDEALTGHVLSMRDEALETVGPTGAGYTVTGVDENMDAEVLRRVRGTFTVPQFLDNTDETKPEASLVLDATGTPQMLGTYQAPFTVIVPAVAATKHPLPVIVYGHGLFNTGESELGGPEGSWLQDFANLEGYVVVATDWIGLSSYENPISTVTNQALSYALTDFSKITWVTDRLQQALVATMVLERTMVGRIVNDPALTVSGQAGGAPVADPSSVHYYGISLGGIMGLSFMGYDPDVTEGVLGCGGGFWATLFQRSVNWKEAALLVPAAYPDSLDGQVLLALAQMQFDYSEPATVAPHVLQAPLPGVPQKQLLMQMGVDDAQVPNVMTEMIARTTGIALFSPAALPVYGMTQAPGPSASALTTWDVHGAPVPPDTNQTPADDNQVHEAIRRIPQGEAQVEAFFATGQVVDTCDGGPCVEPVPPSTPEAGGL